MKSTKRHACLRALLDAGLSGVSRETFESDRMLYGSSWDRRLREIDETHILEKTLKGDFIVRWTLVGRRNLQPQAATKQREVYIGTLNGIAWHEVMA